MSAPEQYIDKLIADTVSRKLTWARSTPTTFVCIFQLSEIPTGQPGRIRLTLNTQQPQYASLRQRLKLLFDKTGENADRDGLDFLRQVIEQ